MAIDDQDEQDAKVTVTKAGGGSAVKILLIVLIILILLIGSVVTTLMLSGALSKSEPSVEDNAEQVTAKKKGTKVPVYFAFEPAFIVNFYDGKQIRYLQVVIEVMSYDEMTIEDIKTHMPVIRNNLILMLSDLSYGVISTVEGKKKLQEQALSEIRSILKDKTGKAGVEELYFTGFVMQ